MNRASGATANGTVVRIFDREVERPPIAHELPDQLAQIAEAQHDAPDPAGVKQPRWMGDEWLAVDLQQSFGDAIRDGAQAGGEASGQNSNGAINSSRLRHHRGALKIESHAHFTEPGCAHGTPQARLVFGIKQQETAAPGADQLASERAVTQRQLIIFIDRRVAHSRGALFLVLPMHLHQFGKTAQVAALESRLRLAPNLLDEMQILDHFLIPLAAARV